MPRVPRMPPGSPATFRRTILTLPLQATCSVASSTSCLTAARGRHIAHAQPLGGPAFIQPDGDIGAGHRGEASDAPCRQDRHARSVQQHHGGKPADHAGPGPKEQAANQRPAAYPALSARHASPDMPPTRDSTITIQIGISISACCSFVIALPHKRKNPAQWPGSVWWCVLLLAVAPIEDGYFYRWIIMAASRF